MQRKTLAALQVPVLESDIVKDETWALGFVNLLLLMGGILVMAFVVNMQTLPTGEHTSLVVMPAQQNTPIISDAVIGQESVNERLSEAIRANQLGNHVSVVDTNALISLELRAHVLFDAGAARLNRSGEALLAKLIPALKNTVGIIFVEGHTDNNPLGSGEYLSNWELAAVRAREVADYLELEGISKDRLRAVSFGDSQPVSDNQSEANRKQNNRINLVIQRLL